jgi:hypothetical protein
LRRVLYDISCLVVDCIELENCIKFVKRQHAELLDDFKDSFLSPWPQA